MEINLRWLQTFAAVSEQLNFTRAAESLGYAQSSVTGQVKALEEAVGQPLFERLGKRVALTEAGRRLLPYANQILALTREALDATAAAESFKGSLRIGAAETLCVFRLPAVFRHFRARCPRVQTHLQTGSCSALRESLRNGSLDLALFLDEPRQEPDLVTRPLVQEPVSLVAYPWHPLASAVAIFPEHLKGESLVHTEPESTYRHQFDRLLAAAGVTPGTIMEFNSIEAIKQCVMAGLGIAVLPYITCSGEFERGTLVELPWQGPPIAVATIIGYHRDKWISPAMTAFLEIVQHTLAK